MLFLELFELRFSEYIFVIEGINDVGEVEVGISWILGGGVLLKKCLCIVFMWFWNIRYLFCLRNIIILFKCLFKIL